MPSKICYCGICRAQFWYIILFLTVFTRFLEKLIKTPTCKFILNKYTTFVFSNVCHGHVFRQYTNILSEKIFLGLERSRQQQFCSDLKNNTL